MICLLCFFCRLFGKTSGVSRLTSVSLPIQVTQKLSNRGIAQSSTVITNCAILFFAKNPVNFSIQQHSLIGSVLMYIKLREGFPKKSSCSFGFCPKEGGRALPNFLSTFHKLYIGSILGWGLANFLAHWRSKKSRKSCSN